MKLLIDSLPARDGGGASYVRQQFSELGRAAPDMDMTALVSPWNTIGKTPLRTETVPVRTLAGRFAYEQVRLPARKADALYCPLNFGPVRPRRPMVLVVHNANYYGRGLHLWETSASRPRWKVAANHLAVRAADVVIAISRSIAEELSDTLPWSAEKTRVIYSGAPAWPTASVRLPCPERYFLSVSSAAPHKRTSDIVRAWSKLSGSSGGCGLVLVGNFTPQQVAEHRTLAGRSVEALVHTGPLRDRRTLKWLYEHARAYISMSLLEAFPLTLGEAASMGCPLILSDIPPHREVAPPHATYVPVRSVDQLAEAMAAELANPSERFTSHWPVSWQDNAASIVAAIREVVC